MKKFSALVLIIGIIYMNAVFAETNYKQPLFSLEFNIYGTGAEIRLNDIPIYFHDTQGQTSSQKPIPEYIIDGENILTIKSFPLEEDDNKYQQGAYIEAIVSVREKDATPSQNKPVFQLKLNPTNQDDKLLEGSLVNMGDSAAKLLSHSDKTTVVERRTHIKSPFPRWAWQDGQLIENTPENFNSLLEKYKEVWESLKSGDMNKINHLYDPAAQEFALAYHYQDKQHGHRLMNTGGLVNDSDWVLADYNKLITKMRYKIDIYANDRIAHIIDQDKRTPVVYLNKKVKILNIQKFGFYKNKNGEWIMIR